MFNTDREPLSRVDNFWLRLDRPYNHMTINTVLILADKLDLECLQKTIATRWVLPYKRFQQRPVYYATGTYWETDPHFEISNHFRRVGLSGAQGKEELEELISNLVSTPLDPNKPLWEFQLVEDYQGGSAVIMRTHHCYADGIAMIHLVLSMTDTAPGVPVDATHSPSRKAIHEDEDKEETLGDIFRQLFQPISDASSNAVKAGRGWLAEGVDRLLHPSKTVDDARQGLGLASRYARQGLGFASEAARLLRLPDEPPIRFRGKLGMAKRVAWAEPLPLHNVKAIGQALGSTINDVVLASVAGALRAYLIEQGDPVDRQLEIRAAVPVNLRPLEQAKNLGNRFGLVLLTLPLGIENPLERLQEVHKRMQELRNSYQAMMTLGLMEIMGLGPNLAQALAMRLLGRKATAVMTNVAGPQQPLYFAGSQLAELMFWVPQSGSVGMGVSIFSYNDRVHFGLMTDQKLVSDPGTIISQFSKEFEQLVLIAMTGPWDKHLDAKAMTTGK